MSDPTPTLTDFEVGALDLILAPTDAERRLPDVVAAVARIKADAVAAALAPVERLPDEWDKAPGRSALAFRVAADDLRAALAEGKGGERRG